MQKQNSYMLILNRAIHFITIPKKKQSNKFVVKRAATYLLKKTKEHYNNYNTKKK